jgi:hypothetical protein
LKESCLAFAFLFMIVKFLSSISITTSLSLPTLLFTLLRLSKTTPQVPPDSDLAAAIEHKRQEAVDLREKTRDAIEARAAVVQRIWEAKDDALSRRIARRYRKKEADHPRNGGNGDDDDNDMYYGSNRNRSNSSSFSEGRRSSQGGAQEDYWAQFDVWFVEEQRKERDRSLWDTRWDELRRARRAVARLEAKTSFAWLAVQRLSKARRRNRRRREVLAAGVQRAERDEAKCLTRKKALKQQLVVKATKQKQKGLTCGELAAAGFTARELHGAGFEPGELKDAGFTELAFAERTQGQDIQLVGGGDDDDDEDGDVEGETAADRWIQAKENEAVAALSPSSKNQKKQLENGSSDQAAAAGDPAGPASSSSSSSSSGAPSPSKTESKSNSGDEKPAVVITAAPEEPEKSGEGDDSAPTASAPKKVLSFRRRSSNRKVEKSKPAAGAAAGTSMDSTPSSSTSSPSTKTSSGPHRQTSSSLPPKLGRRKNSENSSAVGNTTATSSSSPSRHSRTRSPPPAAKRGKAPAPRETSARFAPPSPQGAPPRPSVDRSNSGKNDDGAAVASSLALEEAGTEKENSEGALSTVDDAANKEGGMSL